MANMVFLFSLSTLVPCVVCFCVVCVCVCVCVHACGCVCGCENSLLCKKKTAVSDFCLHFLCTEKHRNNSEVPGAKRAKRKKKKKTMEGLRVEAGQSILLLWFGQNPAESMKDTVNDLLQRVGESGKVQVEHVERLSVCK